MVSSEGATARPGSPYATRTCPGAAEHPHGHRQQKQKQQQQQQHDQQQHWDRLICGSGTAQHLAQETEFQEAYRHSDAHDNPCGAVPALRQASDTLRSAGAHLSSSRDGGEGKGQDRAPGAGARRRVQGPKGSDSDSDKSGDSDTDRDKGSDSNRGWGSDSGNVRDRGRGGDSEALGGLEYGLMAALALVTGCLPLLTRKCVGKEVSVTSQVLACEVLKVTLSTFAILASGAPAAQFKGWSLSGALVAAGVPSAIYSLQNTLLQTSVRHLDTLTFTLLYQTRLISTALCNYVFLKKPQSGRQVTALFLLLLAASLLSAPHPMPSQHPSCATSTSSADSGVSGESQKVLLPTRTTSDAVSVSPETASATSDVASASLDKSSAPSDEPSELPSSTAKGGPQGGPRDASMCEWQWVFGGGVQDTIALGVLPVLLASLTSGLGSAYCQWVLQIKGHSSQVFSVEMACMSILLLSGSSLFPFGSSASTGSGEPAHSHGFFHGWTLAALAPPVANACAGILVGLVTKHAGGVNKGFSVIGGLFVAAVLHCFIEGTLLSLQDWLALPLVVVGLYLYTCYPSVEKKAKVQ